MPTSNKDITKWSNRDLYTRIVDTFGMPHVKRRYKQEEEASKYTIPYIPEKEVMLTTGRYNTGKISTNLLDSIYDSSKRTGVPLDIALGLAGRESTLGIGRGFKEGQDVTATDLYSNWQQIQQPAPKSQVDKWNNTVKKERRGEVLTENDYADRNDFLIGEQQRLEQHKPITEHPIDNALKFYQTGKYNPGDKNHSKMVEEDGKLLMSDPAIQKWLKTKTGTQMKCGGRRKAQLGLDIREGGIAIPIANNMFYIDGRKHAAGGVAIGPNNKNGVEVEGGEVVEMIDSKHPSVGRQFKAGGQQQTMRVFSSVHFLRGASPAELVLGGANPDAVFKAQEEFKDRNRINDDGTTYQTGGQKKSNSAIRTEADKKVPAYNRAVYSLVDPTMAYPTKKEAFGYAIGAGIKAVRNPNDMVYSVTDSVSDAAWRKRHGLSYDDKFLIPNKDGSVRLPKDREMEIPTDTTMIKNRIAANKKLAKRYPQGSEKRDIVDWALKVDGMALDSLRHTYRTGEPVTINEGAYNSRRLINNGELNYPGIMPHNVMQNYAIQYDKSKNKMNYWDTYNFNEFEWGVPGKQFEIKGSVPLKRLGGNMIYEINGNVRNGLSLRPKAKYGTIKRHGKIWKWDEENGAYVPVKDSKEKETINVNKQTNSSISSNKKSNYTINGTFDNARPQYYAEKRLPIAGGKSIAEKAGLARSGWSYADSPKFDYAPNINISVPTNYAKAVGDNTKKSTSSTARGEGNKTSKSKSSSQSTSTIQDTVNKITTDAWKASKTPKIKIDESKMPSYNVSDLGSKETKTAKAKLNSSSTGGGTQSKNTPWIGQYKTFRPEDWAGLGTNLAGHIAGYFANNSLLKKYPMPVKPVLFQAAKLKTTHNINPKLATSRETEQMNLAEVGRNTSSSSTNIARKQRIMNEARDARNKLYGEKENIETQLINLDRRNRQDVYNRNISAYNDWLDKTYIAKTNKLLEKQKNIMSLINGIPSAVNHTLGVIETRRNANNAYRAIAAANPNVDARQIGGFDYYEGIGPDGTHRALYDKHQRFVRYI